MNFKFIYRILIIFPLLFGLFQTPQITHAKGEFSTDISVTYDINDSGTTTVSHEIVMTNRLSAVYATGYTLSLDGTTPQEVQAWDKKGPLTTSIEKTNKGTKINTTFNDQVVGGGRQLTFTIRYQQNDVASRKGQIWEIIIPKQSDSENVDNYTVQLVVPKSFGKPAYLSPKPSVESSVDRQIFSFGKTESGAARIVAAFGQFQVFDFKLNYFLKNEEKSTSLLEIALPPDTPYQRMRYESIEPKPQSISQDVDGNWLASYQLKVNEELSLEAKGSAQIFATPQKIEKLSTENRQMYLLPSEFWQTEDIKIKDLARTLKTPKEIYDYVTQHLTYNFNRVSKDAKRLGAKAAIDNPESAICTEFTDLFIALSRAAGIPAREIEGYAYTTDPNLEPLSLVEDVLHAWPEYWDESSSNWIQVDPTWGATTGGVDFFSKLDLNHFAFVIHGQNPHLPYPAGSYRQDQKTKSVVVNFGIYQQEPIEKLEIDLLPGSIIQIPLLWQQGTLKVTNKQGSSIQNLQISNSDRVTLNGELIKTLPPFGAQEQKISYRMPFFFPWTPDPKIIVTTNLSNHTLTISKQKIQYVQLISLGIYLVSITITVFLLKLRKRLFKK